MAVTPIITGQTFEGNDATVLSRVDFNGSNIQQADLSSIGYKIYKKNDPGTLIDSGTLTVANVIFDTLQTDSIWTQDSTGYNFKTTVAGANLADPDVIYRVEFQLTGTGGELAAVVAEITTLPMIGN